MLQDAAHYLAVPDHGPDLLVIVSSDSCQSPASVTGELTLLSRSRQDSERPGNGVATVEVERRMAANVILKGTFVSGNINSPNDITVDGTIHGEVRALHVWIGRDASVEGAVVADRVTVEGAMRGPIFAGHVHLGAASSVNGDLCSDNITIDKGAMFTGRVWPSQSPSHAYPRQERLARTQLSPNNSSMSAPKAPEPVATEKSPPVGPDGAKDP